MKSKMLTVHFACFAKARELYNSEMLSVQVLPNSSLQEALRALQEVYPLFTTTFLGRCRIAKDKKYVKDITSVFVEDQETYTIIPPISGG
jgi:hypothetical protein